MKLSEVDLLQNLKGDGSVYKVYEEVMGEGAYSCNVIGNNIYFSGEINHESVADLLNAIYQAELEGLEKINLYFSTSGGMLTAQEILLDILKNDVNIPITFIIKTECWSAGTNIIFELIDEPLFSFKISKYASFLFHTPLFDSKSRNLSFNKVNDSIAEIWKEDVVEKLYKNFFTSEELIIKINCDEEVYLTATEFYYIVSHDINNKKRDNVEYIRE